MRDNRTNKMRDNMTNKMRDYRTKKVRGSLTSKIRYNRTNNVRRTYSYMTQTVREDMTNKNRGTTRLTRLGTGGLQRWEARGLAKCKTYCSVSTTVKLRFFFLFSYFGMAMELNFCREKSEKFTRFQFKRVKPQLQYSRAN